MSEAIGPLAAAVVSAPDVEALREIVPNPPHPVEVVYNGLLVAHHNEIREGGSGGRLREAMAVLEEQWPGEVAAYRKRAGG